MLHPPSQPRLVMAAAMALAGASIAQPFAASNCPPPRCSTRPQRVRTHSPTPFLRLMVDLLMFFADTYHTVFKVGCCFGCCVLAFIAAVEAGRMDLLMLVADTYLPHGVQGGMLLWLLCSCIYR